jgi:leucyl-tRNA synthetase
MDYNFKAIEAKWQQKWKDDKTYHVEIEHDKPKYYVLDMFPYPSGAGLHVGHPLGYIAGDIYARYKRLQGFNVLHPMGYDAYGLPAEQYAIQTGQHPAITTDRNIARYREQLDKIGFCFDWDREVHTCDADYYKWTQWAFILMFNSYYCNQAKQARPISELIEYFEKQGNKDLDIAQTEELHFTADEWNSFDEKEQQETLMNYRIAYLAETTVNWCEALGTVLANDEVQDGMSIRGGYPVVQKKMKQWSLRVSAYAQRLLDGLETIDWSDSLKETQRNWIGRSEGAEMRFNLSTNPSPQERGTALDDNPNGYGWFTKTTNKRNWELLSNMAKEYRSKQTEAENILWENVRAKKTGYKIRRQHVINGFIADFINLEKQVIIEVDGDVHLTPEMKERDEQRTHLLNELGFEVIRFTNDEVLNNVGEVIKKIKDYLDKTPSKRDTVTIPLSCEEGQGERCMTVFTTRADTIYGVTFMVLAPESEYVAELTTPEQKAEVDAYIEQVKRRTERERIADRKVTGVFSGSYAINPVSREKIPIWISDYVLAGYGTGAIMAVPAHDSRDYAFAKHFNLPIIPLIEGADVSEESFDAKEGTMMNSPAPSNSPKGGEQTPSLEGRVGEGLLPLVLNGLSVKEAIEKTKKYVADNNLGKVKINYRLRDAIFSRQRYWGEPFPIYYKDGMPYPVAEKDLPIELPEVDKFLPTETGEPPLGRAKDWVYEPPKQ